MRDVFVVDAVRTPIGRRRGGLAEVHPTDLGAAVLSELVDRSGVDADLVEDVIFGCVTQVGAQASNVARVAWLSAGLPVHVPGVVVDRRCGSGQQAVDFAANAIRAGQQDIVIAGGVESMSIVPIGSAARWGTEHGAGVAYGGAGWIAHHGDAEPSQFVAADEIARRWDVTREEMEAFAVESHRRAVHAIDAGYFDREIVPVAGVTRDEGPRRDTSSEKMAAMPPLLDGGLITAALSSQVSDAASALLLASQDAVEKYGLVPRARIVASAVVGSDPELILTGPITSTPKVLERAGLSMADIDLFECNEAFASVVLAWAQETKAPAERTNVNGGAISLGHPLGATGARLLTSVVHELERTGGRYGLVTMCEGGGTSNATVLERVS
ncbi:acetyl-CoA C-acyltransferase [Nakamurella sp. YIM 132087]|uniref:Acetyl-CoA C-acyltransferase n=1 Tax=Nakamurella alba TaxID=2665158 RepID=A0A7K1FKX1_9ACTN|nr:acetyl-CoA C-acyltransferase [Nakamurella alba]MTD14039.1 acetyl-CoA C-acyltransferase [Nakamurella alba]